MRLNATACSGKSEARSPRAGGQDSRSGDLGAGAPPGGAWPGIDVIEFILAEEFSEPHFNVN